MTHLEIITRTFGQRQRFLARNQASLSQQTDPDWTQRLVLDELGRGVSWANANLGTLVAEGEYVWILDDDDFCARDTLVAEIKAIAAESQPDVIMVRVEQVVYGLLPANWQTEPKPSSITMSNFIVRRQVWNDNAHAWSFRYESDYYYAMHLWQQAGLRWYWHDVVAASIPQISTGASP